MSEKFHAKKQKILDALSKPNGDYTDASPKGSVDDGVRDLIVQINDTPGFVTTSSCAGRIAVYLEGPPKPVQNVSRSADYEETASILPDDSVTSSAGGKGGGRWLFGSHSPVDLSSVASPGMLHRLFGFPSQSEVSFPSADARPQFVHFKFEPMILHILTSSAEDAQAALQAATQSGFRESGISGLLDNKGQPSTPMVAVRSSGLALDSVIGFKDLDSSTTGVGTIQPMVSESYLRAIVRLANERFSINEERKVRFFDAFYQQRPAQISGSKAGSIGFESRAARKERKRAEGLTRQQQMLLVGGALDGTAQ
jgi:tRNA wybutosine-synthesizing protein 3